MMHSNKSEVPQGKLAASATRDVIPTRSCREHQDRRSSHPPTSGRMGNLIASPFHLRICRPPRTMST